MRKNELLKLLESVPNDCEIVLRTIICSEDEKLCSTVKEAYKDYDEEIKEEIFVIEPKEVIVANEDKYMNLYEEEKKKRESLEDRIKFISQHIRDLKNYLMECAPEDSPYKLGHEEIQKKIDVINSIDIVETENDYDGMIYVLVENTEENIKKLKSIGFTDDDIAESCGINNLEELEEDDDIDICMLAFKWADYYYKGKFYQIEDVPEEE